MLVVLLCLVEVSQILWLSLHKVPPEFHSQVEEGLQGCWLKTCQSTGVAVLTCVHGSA